MKSWASCCAPHEEGGFNIKEVLAWNRSILCKWIWAIENQSHSIWSIWNQLYNIKAEDFWTMQIKPYHSESWRSILNVRNDLIAKAGDIPNAKNILKACTKEGKFKLSLIYDQLRSKYSRVYWVKGIWCRAVLPKHSFCTVLAMQHKLATIDKLTQKGLCLVNRCILCKAGFETHNHLFFKCPYAYGVWSGVLNWIKVQGRSAKLRTELMWISHRKKRKHWKASWFSSCLNATVYSIWEERNMRVFREIEHNIDYLIKRIQYLVSVRLLFVTHPLYEDEIVDELNS